MGRPKGTGKSADQAAAQRGLTRALALEVSNGSGLTSDTLVKAMGLSKHARPGEESLAESGSLWRQYKSGLASMSDERLRDVATWAWENDYAGPVAKKILVSAHQREMRAMSEAHAAERLAAVRKIANALASFIPGYKGDAEEKEEIDKHLQRLYRLAVVEAKRKAKTDYYERQARWEERRLEDEARVASGLASGEIKKMSYEEQMRAEAALEAELDKTTLLIQPGNLLMGIPEIRAPKSRKK